MNIHAVPGAVNDSYRHNPWRAPGSAPVVDPWCAALLRALSLFLSSSANRRTGIRQPPNLFSMSARDEGLTAAGCGCAAGRPGASTARPRWAAPPSSAP